MYSLVTNQAETLLNVHRAEIPFLGLVISSKTDYAFYAILVTNLTQRLYFSDCLHS